jgi:thiosulfate/3-mercaptopyruvate sulfurtransferase
VVFIYQTLNLSLGSFALIFTLVAVACFWGVEFLERRRGKETAEGRSKFLTFFSLGLVVLALGLTLFSGTPAPSAGRPAGEAELIAQVEGGRDHLDPEELADRLMRGEPNLLVVDIRPAGEYQVFHIRGAVNIPLSKLAEELAPHKNQGVIVLYSNGMTHPAQARDSLSRQGYGNVYLLTDGLQGFMERCLKPVSLRSEPLTPEAAGQGLAGLFQPGGGRLGQCRRRRGYSPTRRTAPSPSGAGGARLAGPASGTTLAQGHRPQGSAGI